MKVIQSGNEKNKKWEKVRRGRNNAAETNNEAEIERNNGERKRKESATDQDYFDIIF